MTRARRRRSLRAPLVVAASTFLVGAALSLVTSALVQPAQAREFDPLVVTQDAPTLATFEGIPENLRYVRKADPDLCRDAAFCDTIPLKIPPPDLPPGAGFRLVIKASNDDDANLRVIVWDDTQLKSKYGKCEPGEQCYDPLDTDYTDLVVITNVHTGGPESNGVYKIGEPDLVDYNITVLNYSGFNESYTLYLELETEEFDRPIEVPPPDANQVPTQQQRPRSFSPATETPDDDPAPGLGDPDEFSLNDLLIEQDPDLRAIRDQNLADQLKAPPSQIAQIGRVEAGPPPPVSGATLLLWLGAVPAGLAGGVTTLVQRRRVRLPELS